MLLKLVLGETYSARRAVLFLLLLLLPTAIFLNNEAVWDDRFIFESHSFWSWHALFGPYLDGLANKIPYWRPITVLTIALPDLLHAPIWVNKFINIALFYVQAWLTIAITDGYLRSRKLASNSLPLIALAVVLALHPVFVETQLWISARADLLLGLFVMFTALWLTRIHDLQNAHHDPESAWLGIVRGLLLPWLLCGAKDTGVVWSVILLLIVCMLSLQSNAAWRRYWLCWAGGASLALASYLAARVTVLGQVAATTDRTVHAANTATEHLQIFTEFIVRAMINIFLPLLDQAPFKSSGWFVGFSPFALATVLLITAILVGILLFKIYRNSRTATLFVLCALVLVLFHATLESIAPSTNGCVLATRYLAPGSALIFMALVICLARPAPTTDAAYPIKFSVPIAAVFLALLLQSLLMWTETRLSWSSNLALWETSWEHDSQSRLVAEGYFAGYFVKGDVVTARQIARHWIANNQEPETTTRLCKLYEDILEADVILKDQDDGAHFAYRALQIGWCHPTLARNISYFQMKDHCKLVLPMIYQAIGEGDKPKGTGVWQFKNSAQRNQFMLLAAYGEARCGTLSAAQDRFSEIARSAPEWVPSGVQAQALIHAAQTDK